MARNFKELEVKMAPEAIEKSNALANAYLAEMALQEVRQAQNMTQAELAEKLGKDQGVISRMEKRADMYVSTLRKAIEAMGGKLHILAEFPHGSVEIVQFDHDKLETRTDNEKSPRNESAKLIGRSDITAPRGGSLMSEMSGTFRGRRRTART